MRRPRDWWLIYKKRKEALGGPGDLVGYKKCALDRPKRKLNEPKTRLERVCETAQGTSPVSHGVRAHASASPGRGTGANNETVTPPLVLLSASPSRQPRHR
jgi:hypothetical protein